MRWRELAFGDDRGALGDVLCTPSEHTAAAAAIGTLVATMQQADAAVRDAYRPQVNALLSTWNALEQQRIDSFLSRANPAFWCNFKSLAQRAEPLTRAIADASSRAGKKIAPPTVDPNLDPSSSPVDTVIKVATVAAVGAIAAATLPGLLDRRRRA